MRQTRGRPFARVFTDGASEQRFICEFVFGKRLPWQQATPRRMSPAARQPPAWTDDASWKHRLTNLRLFLQPVVVWARLLPFHLRIHPLPHLSAGLADLCALMNIDHPLVPL